MWNILSWIFGLLFLILIAQGIKINKQWERAIVLRLGKYNRTAGAGVFFKLPLLEQIGRLDIRTNTIDVAKQNVITKDSVSVMVNAIVYYRIREKELANAILEVENFEQASTTLAQTTLRDILGKNNLDELLSNKKLIADQIKKIIDEATDPWGINVQRVEIKDVELPENMERALAKESEAVREKRARITKAEGELEASKKLKIAGDMLGKTKYGFALRQLQTLQEIGTEQNSTIIVVPSEMASNPSSLAIPTLAKLDMNNGIEDEKPEEPNHKKRC
jgi:regulator of protease activity HflC (stomatin/prohibitin superfamily)